MNHRILTAVFSLSLALLTGACGTLNLQVEETNPAPLTQVTSTTAPALTTESTPAESGQGESAQAARVEFTELGISLEVPKDLYVIKEPEVNLDDSSKLSAYLFYIQNYGGDVGPGSDYFQMYGLLQYDLPPTTWEQFAQVADSPTEYAYINPIEINGVRGFEGQFSGPRNRFIYLFYLDGRVLTIAVADPTPENKALADSIIQTLEPLPGGWSDASGVVPVTDPNGLYSLLIPDDWTYEFNPAPRFNLSELEARSADYEVQMEDGAGHSDIYYKHGVSMIMIVYESDTPIGEPYREGILSQQTIYFNGIEGTEYYFFEPSLAEGELREVRISHNGKNYSMRFGIASDANTDDIDRIIRSLTLAE